MLLLYNENKYKLSYCNCVNLDMKYLISIVLISLSFSKLSLDLIASGFEQPLYVAVAPNNNNKLFIVEQEGYIRSIDLSNNSLETIFLDITDRVHKPLFPGDEMGFLGLVFDPNYSQNKLIYINYNDKDENTIVSRIKLIESENFEEEILLKFQQPYSNHNGGHMTFGPDGYLYISVGDGGSSGDPDNRAQDLSNIFGKILRIDVSLIDKKYQIPIDNPFTLTSNYVTEIIRKNNLIPDVIYDEFGMPMVVVKETIPNPEIWVYGLRNVWRFSFDRLTGDMYLGDVGQNSWEEINFIPRYSKGGINFGWNFMEASSCFRDDVNCEKLTLNLKLPIFEYPNDAKYVRTLLGLKQKNRKNLHGCSVTGGYVYRGSAIPELYGKYIFGDYCTGKVWSFKYKFQKVTEFEDHTDELHSSINKKNFYLSSFGESNDGELFLVDYDGNIYKLIDKNSGE